MSQPISAKSALTDLRSLAKAGKAADLQRFFKTAPGEYGEGDIFLGVMVPQTREIAREYRDMSLAEIEKLVSSKFHEARLCGLIILTNQFLASKEPATKKVIFNFYLRQMKDGHINNWDLVDVTAPALGQYLLGIRNPYAILDKLATSKSLWERRLSIIFTFAFIRAGDFGPTIEISKMLIDDEHDLIHKAVGWSLREVGKRDIGVLRVFLGEYSNQMPRTMLRYAIEKLPEKERKKWLAA